ncbi:MAG: hypothetical protein ACLGII_05970 [Gammaproteobacteria bacterium]
MRNAGFFESMKVFRLDIRPGPERARSAVRALDVPLAAGRCAEGRSSGDLT